MNLNNTIPRKHNMQDDVWKTQFLQTEELQPVNCNTGWAWHKEQLSRLLKS